MLNKVKLALRVSNNAYDEEITDLISTAKADLNACGVTLDDDSDLQKRAIILYCKANFGFDNNEADRFSKAYEALKGFLCLYKVEDNAL